MFCAGRERPATADQRRVILDLTGQADFAGVKRLEGCPPLQRYGSDLDDLDNRTAARLIDGLIRWKGIYG